MRRVCLWEPTKSKTDAPLLPFFIPPSFNFLSFLHSSSGIFFFFCVPDDNLNSALSRKIYKSARWAWCSHLCQWAQMAPEPRLEDVALYIYIYIRLSWLWCCTCSAPPSLECIIAAAGDPFGAATAWVFPWSTVRSCLLLIYLSVCADILDVDLSWPVFIWIWGEQRRFCCALCFGLTCAFLEGRGERRGWSESSAGLHKSQYPLQNKLDSATEC